MSWLEKLCQTYDENKEQVGIKDKSGSVLVPIFHTHKNAQIAVTIDESGHFRDARVIEKSEQEKIIPCSEDSNNRTGGPCSHPLFESLQYVAGDLAECAKPGIDALRKEKKGKEQKTSDEKSEKANTAPEKMRQKLADSNRLYLTALNDWCTSDASHPLACIVYQYLSQKTLTRDLANTGLLPLDADGVSVSFPRGKSTTPLTQRYKDDIHKTFIIFEIYRKNGTTVRLDEEQTVREQWIEYYSQKIAHGPNCGFCEILGQTLPLARLHPKRIRSSADNAKLISSNDTRNFTYRGQFASPEQASGISMECSLKAHAALCWLLRKQGSHNGDQYWVAWAVTRNPEVPPLLENTHNLCSLEDALQMEQPRFDLGTAEAAAQALNLKIAGYHAKLDAQYLCLMLLDSATQGTLAIKFYRELEGSRYLQRVENWHTQCAWQQDYGQNYRFYGAPSPRDIAYAAYGNHMKETDPRLRNTIKRLLPCILDAVPIPPDFLQCMLRRLSNPIALGPQEFQKTLGIACALYKHIHAQERNYTMSLESSLSHRDYLYGRLLAIADDLEGLSLAISGEKRTTNALRSMPFFVKRPFSAWNTLFARLNPYRERLRINAAARFAAYEKDLEEIHALFNHEEFVSDEPLSGEYIMGYYCQKAELKRRSKKTAAQSDDATTDQP